MPILLFSGARRRDFAESFARTFDVSKYSSIHTLLLALWERYGANLFQPGDWNAELKHEERYSTPERAAS